MPSQFDGLKHYIVVSLLYILTLFGLVLLLGGATAAFIAGSAWAARRLDADRSNKILQLAGFRWRDQRFVGDVAGRPAVVDRGPPWTLTVTELPTDLALRNSSQGTRKARTGDRSIDSRWAIGSVHGGVGRLGIDARRALQSLGRSCRGATLSEGICRVTLDSYGDLPGAISAVQAFASAIHGDPGDCLARTVKTDRNPRVRGQMLWELAQHDRVRATELVSKRDPNSNWGPEELLLMGELLADPALIEQAFHHPKTRDVLAGRALASWLTLDQEPAIAITWMVERFGASGLIAAARHLDDRESAVALVPWVSSLRQLPAATKEVMGCLVKHQLFEAMPNLMDALREGSASRKSLLSAIGRLGTIEHVAELRRFQDKLGLAEFLLSQDVDLAVTLIQARISGGAGALSVAEVVPDAGAVSVAEEAPLPLLEEVPMARADSAPARAGRAITATQREGPEG